MIPAPNIFAPDELQSLAQGIFPDGVEVSIAFPWDAPDDLWPEEAACLPKALDKRLREFAAGRRAARVAMRALGHPANAILHGADRAPVWPEGLVGSISHTDDLCLSALASASRFSSLGLDLEEDADLPCEIWQDVCTITERAWLSVQPEAMRGRLARLIFCAKECAYKLQYPTSGQMLDFDAFEITLDLETCQFEATLTRPVPNFAERTRFSGRFATGMNMIMTGMALPHKL